LITLALDDGGDFRWRGRRGRCDDRTVTEPPTTLAVLVGLQASGKSTFVAGGRFAGWVRVSKDDWPNARRRQRRQLRVIDAALLAGRDVVVDNTNPSPAEWEPLIELARARGARVEAFWFPPDLEVSLARNAGRSGVARVPDVGIFATVSVLQEPSTVVGFDAVWRVTTDGRGGFLVAPLTVGAS
jgi:predicted kinase